MNSGVQDALAAACRLAALIKVYGGPHLIPSYEAEQRTMVIKRMSCCDSHIQTHSPRYKTHSENPQLTFAKTEEGKACRREIAKHLQTAGPETIDHGMELDVRYRSAVIYQDDSQEPPWEFRRYHHLRNQGHVRQHCS